MSRRAALDLYRNIAHCRTLLTDHYKQLKPHTFASTRVDMAVQLDVAADPWQRAAPRKCSGNITGHNWM